MAVDGVERVVVRPNDGGAIRCQPTDGDHAVIEDDTLIIRYPAAIGQSLIGVLFRRLRSIALEASHVRSRHLASALRIRVKPSAASRIPAFDVAANCPHSPMPPTISSSVYSSSG